MDEQDINSLSDSGADSSGSGFWAGLGQSLGAGATAILNNAVNKNQAQQITSGTPTTQQTQAQQLAAKGINPTWLIAGGVILVGAFALIALSPARR